MGPSGGLGGVELREWGWDLVLGWVGWSLGSWEWG